ncbi:MAG TPA: pentapeptide repeat-containing protein [Candidatus Eisenbacteria bacterium]|nr:pentapeptide repeat-containing protein [Candidatus Eisenbacteria bacterium]
MDDDVQRVKEAAASALTHSEDVEAVTKAAQLLKLASEIENQQAQVRKTESDVQDSIAHKKTKDLKEFIALLAPVFTTFVLAGTLVLQSYQFSRSERDKEAEAQQQREAAALQAKQQADAAEDASWADALKLLSGSEKVSPAAVLLKRFSQSPRYSEEARRTALGLLSIKTTDPEAFQSLFGSVFEPVSWENLPQILEIDRQLYQKIRPLLTRFEKLNPSEKAQYESLNSELVFISNGLALLLKAPRPPAQVLDFHSAALWSTDLQGADLSGADLTDGNFGSLNLRGANLSGITKFNGGPNFAWSAWWEASQVSPQLRDYLEKNFRFDSKLTYASGRKYTEPEYQADLTRLQSSSH